MFFYTDERRIFCVDSRSGSRKWSTRIDTVVLAAPSISGNTIFFREHRGGIIGLDTQSGRRIIDHKIFKEGRDPLVFYEGRIFLGTELGLFTAIETY